MTRSVLHILGDSFSLELDTFNFLSDHTDDHAEGGAARANGLDLALNQPAGSADGLGLALTAPAGTPFGPDIFDHSSHGLSELTGMNGIAFTDLMFAAKGGNGGGGGKPGGGGGGSTDPSVLSSYTSEGANHNSGLDYNIEVSFKGSNWTSALQVAFETAADYISTIITNDISDVFFRGKIIDDIHIDASLSDIDGVGGVLGQAGPTAYRTADYLPATATMQFDIADAANFDSLHLFDDIVLHEMLHSIGFGTMWEMMGLTTGTIADGTLQFNGPDAIAAYIAEFGATGATGVPIETDYGSGTAGGHWDEATFQNELMTGFIGTLDDYQEPNYVSGMTVAALEDMGYETQWNLGGPAGVNLPLAPINDALLA